MYLVATLEATSQQSSWSKAMSAGESELNIPDMVSTLEISQLLISWLNAGASLNIDDMVLTLETSHLLMSWLNEEGTVEEAWNICSMWLTSETSQPLMSSLKFCMFVEISVGTNGGFVKLLSRSLGQPGMFQQ
jgi:hypothetical protein